MPRPHGATILLDGDARRQLESLLRAHSTPQTIALRCRIVLRAADPDQPTNEKLAHELGCERHTVGLWRRRFRSLGVAGLADAPRSGRPRSFSPPTEA